MFEDATFHSSGIHPTQAPKWMLLTLTLNLAVVATMIILPLLYPQGLPGILLHRILYAPAPTPTVLPQTRTAPMPTQTTQLTLNPYQAPTVIPPTIRTDPGPPPSGNPFAISNPSSADSIPGAIPNPAIFHQTTPTVGQAKPQKATVSEGVAAGLLLTHPNPVYPPIAIAAHVSGTVVLAATISTSGTIENLHVLSGSPMLTSAAVEAVKTWRYRPYQLNHQPVEVDTTINVVFSLGGR